ncbi:actin binding [Mactra antiquata]
MARKSEVVCGNSGEDFINLQDVLYSFNNSINEEQAWAVCYQCVQFFVQNPTQDNYRDLYYYGIIAIQLSKEGDVKVEVNFNQGTGKGPPKKRSSFSLSREFKTVITESDVTQALGTAIYKALDYGLSESEEPHLSSELELLIESLTDQPTDDDEGIDIERDSDHDTEENQDQNKSLFQNIIDKCIWRLSNQQNAQQHYKAVCRALATEATELLTFLDNIARTQEKLAASTSEGEQTVDDLERSDWARLWVQTMRELRHGVRLKKVEQVHLPPVEFELTPFEILLEDIRLGRYKLNRIMVNGDIPRKVKDDAHAVILDFIRSRPPLKPVNKRTLKEAPKREMDPRELLLQDICKPHKLKPVRHGKRVVRKPTTDCDNFNDSSDEDTVKPTRKVIKPVASFQVSTDESDSFVSDIEDDYTNGRHHIVPALMSPLEPLGPEDIDDSWKRAVARDLVSQPSREGRSQPSVTRRHTISACDAKSQKQVFDPTQHALVQEEEEESNSVVHRESFSRGHTLRKASKFVSYRKKQFQSRQQHVNEAEDRNVVNAQNTRNHDNLHNTYPAPQHVNHCVSHGNVVNDVFSVPNSLHDPSSDISRLSRSVSVASLSDRPSNNNGRSQSPTMHAGRAQSPVRHLSRSETFTCSVPRKSRVHSHRETHVATRCDSPQTRAMRAQSPNKMHRSESLHRRHSVQQPVHSASINGSACDTHHISDNVHRHSFKHVHGSVSNDSRSRRHSQPLQRHASFTGACIAKSRHSVNNTEFNHSDHKYSDKVNKNSEVIQKHVDHSQRICSDNFDQTRNIQRSRSTQNIRKSVSTSDQFDSVKNSQTSHVQERRSNLDLGDSDKVIQVNTETTVRRSRTAVIRARTRPESSGQRVKEEDELFKVIEQPGRTPEAVHRPEIRRSASEVSFDRQARGQVIRARNHLRRPISSRAGSIEDKNSVDAENIDNNNASNKTLQRENSDTDGSTKRGVRLTRQSAIRTERPDVQSKLPVKTNSSVSEHRNDDDNESKVSRSDNLTSRVRVRRSGVVSPGNNSLTNENRQTSDSNSDNSEKLVKSDVTPTNDDTQRTPRRHEFRQVRPLMRSRSEVRPTKPVKGSHNLPVDFEHNNIDHADDKHVIIPPPEFRDPEDVPDSSTNDSNTDTACDVDDIPDVIKTSRAEFKIVDLLHVSWKSECTRVDHTNQSNPCPDCRPSPPPHKWQNPIECLSLTLEEVTHIRCVLTKAELEGLIINPELYSQVSKGKVCFTCKKTKFSLFGQWGTKCKFCQRTVCNYCLRKMSVPTEHFEKIPVYTLSPVPLSQEVLDALKVYESTGSVPHSPVLGRNHEEQGTNVKKSVDFESPCKEDEDAETPTSEENKAASKRRSLQRSHTIGVGVGSRPPPNKALLKGPQMSICCDCKTMIMEIIRASRSSVSLITGKPDTSPEQKDSPPVIRQVSARPSSVIRRPRNLDLENKPRPRSMLDNFKSFNFTRNDTTDA